MLSFRLTSVLCFMLASLFSGQSLADGKCILTICEHNNFLGSCIPHSGNVEDFSDFNGLNDKASSLMANNCNWAFCADENFAYCDPAPRGTRIRDLGASGVGNDAISSIYIGSDTSNQKILKLCSLTHCYKDSENREYCFPIRNEYGDLEGYDAGNIAAGGSYFAQACDWNICLDKNFGRCQVLYEGSRIDYLAAQSVSIQRITEWGASVPGTFDIMQIKINRK